MFLGGTRKHLGSCFRAFLGTVFSDFPWVVIVIHMFRQLAEEAWTASSSRWAYVCGVAYGYRYETKQQVWAVFMQSFPPGCS